MTKSKWIFVVIICLIVLGGLVVASGRNNIDVSRIDTNEIVKPGTKAGNVNLTIGDHVFGNTSGKVLLVEYGDFQCPSCKALYPNLKPLLDYYKNSLSFVFRNYPLTTIHPNALAAASAAEAAGQQGKYWEMNQKLYTEQDTWSGLDAADRTKVFDGFSSQLGLNANKFSDAMTSVDVSTKIKFDTSLGQKLNVNATPTLYLNGKQIPNETSDAVQGKTSAIEALIRKSLEEAGMAMPDKPLTKS